MPVDCTYCKDTRRVDTFAGTRPCSCTRIADFGRDGTRRVVIPKEER